MANTLAVAKYLNDLCKQETGADMTEMKMHKLMYFSQREALMNTNEPLFGNDFEAWRYGPVLPEVRDEYHSTTPKFSGNYGKLSDVEKSLVAAVYTMYASRSAWTLSSLSHEEYSWKQARAGLSPDAPSQKKLSLSAMRVDAKRELLRRKGVLLA